MRSRTMRPMMTRMHFCAIAHALADCRPVEPEMDDLRYGQWLLIMKVIGDMCQSANGNFDRGRFETACKEW